MTRNQIKESLYVMEIQEQEEVNVLNKKLLTKKYRQLMKKYHPDVEGGDTRKASDINNAYEILKKWVEEGKQQYPEENTGQSGYTQSSPYPYGSIYPQGAYTPTMEDLYAGTEEVKIFLTFEQYRQVMVHYKPLQTYNTKGEGVMLNYAEALRQNVYLNLDGEVVVNGLKFDFLEQFRVSGSKKFGVSVSVDKSELDSHNEQEFIGIDITVGNEMYHYRLPRSAVGVYEYKIVVDGVIELSIYIQFYSGCENGISAE